MTDTREKPAKRRGRPPKAVKAPPSVKAIAEDLVEAAPVVERPAMRPAMRSEDPRAAAARRAAEIRGHIGSLDEGTDEFYIDPASVPDGWTYEWKRKTVLGQEDPAYQVHLARTGWEPVPTSAHPEMMPGQGHFPNVERKGMALMMRPASITDEVRDIEYRKARQQVRVKEQQLNAAPEGQFERNNKDAPMAKIKKSYEAIPVPKD